MPSPVTITTLLNQYRVEAFVTVTPLGELYRVTDERSNKYFALTILSKSLADNTEAVKELEGNSSRLQGISHLNLNKYLGVTRNTNNVFLLEEWVDGPSLKDIRSRGRLSADEALFIAKGIGGALETLHKHNFIHLHLAPELVRLNQRGEVVVCGIAAASAVHFNTVKYPPMYTAPEQIREESPTSAADIYATAVLLYELTTGFWITGKSAPKTMDAIRKTHLESPSPAPSTLNPSLPDNFSRMLLWALRKNPEERFKTTTELLSALALATQITLDKVPARATPEQTPAISNLLNAWEFLPPPKPTSVSADTVPLDERLASLTGPKKRSAPRLRLLPILLFALLAGFLSLFFFIRPAEQTAFLPSPVVFTVPPFAFTPEPTASLTPRPTLTNGGRIVFTCTRGEYNQLCMINRDGSDLVQLTDMAASNYYPVFTPDASSILFASNRAGPNFDFFLLNFAEREVFQLTVNIGNVIAPDFSPDGRTIAFANRVGNNPTAIWMVNADGLNPRLVYTGTGDIVSLAWSPDGTRLAYAMNTGTPQEYEIFTMDANGRNHLKISQGLQGIGGSVDWSPDGTSLLIHAGPFGDKDIFRVEVATGIYIQLTDGGNNAGASYSPNGQFIVFNSLRNNDQADLYIMEADGSGMRQITNDPEPDWGASWIE